MACSDSQPSAWPWSSPSSAPRTSAATGRIRPLRGVLADACEFGSGDRLVSTPMTARAYLDWLGGFLVETTTALEVDAMGMHGWRFDTGARLPIPTRSEACNLVSLAE